ncbi:MAG: hypothetical protein HQK66_15110 [Desulfamplus sp.]|nr:hypothetical protein [Desulfamplus sp.]
MIQKIYEVTPLESKSKRLSIQNSLDRLSAPDSNEFSSVDKISQIQEVEPVIEGLKNIEQYQNKQIDLLSRLQPSVKQLLTDILALEKELISGILHNPSKVVDTFFEIIPEKWECGSRKCKPANEGCLISFKEALFKLRLMTKVVKSYVDEGGISSDELTINYSTDVLKSLEQDVSKKQSDIFSTKEFSKNEIVQITEHLRMLQLSQNEVEKKINFLGKFGILHMHPKLLYTFWSINLEK